MRKDWEKLPLFHKAGDILNLVEHLVKTVAQTDIEFEREIQTEMLKNNLQYLRQNALIIPAKIAGAANEDTPYDLKMENAAIIRKTAKELLTDATSIEMHGFKNIEYLDLLRKEVDEFRVLFAEWVKTFNPWNYNIDRWGLFNPHGINYDDHDPDDDLPINPDDFSI